MSIVRLVANPTDGSAVFEPQSCSRHAAERKRLAPAETPGPTTRHCPTVARFRPYRGQACLESPLAARRTSKSRPRSEPETPSVPLLSRGHSARWRRTPSWHDPEPPFHWCCQEPPEVPSPRQRTLQLLDQPQVQPRRPRPRAIASKPWHLSRLSRSSWTVRPRSTTSWIHGAWPSNAKCDLKLWVRQRHSGAIAPRSEHHRQRERGMPLWVAPAWRIVVTERRGAERQFCANAWASPIESSLSQALVPRVRGRG
jgi:hypothetical protein